VDSIDPSRCLLGGQVVVDGQTNCKIVTHQRIAEDRRLGCIWTDSRQPRQDDLLIVQRIENCLIVLRAVIERYIRHTGKTCEPRAKGNVVALSIGLPPVLKSCPFDYGELLNHCDAHLLGKPFEELEGRCSCGLSVDRGCSNRYCLIDRRQLNDSGGLTVSGGLDIGNGLVVSGGRTILSRGGV